MSPLEGPLDVSTPPACLGSGLPNTADETVEVTSENPSFSSSAAIMSLRLASTPYTGLGHQPLKPSLSSASTTAARRASFSGEPAATTGPVTASTVFEETAATLR